MTVVGATIIKKNAIKTKLSCLILWYLDGAFKSHQDVAPLLLAGRRQDDVIVQVSQLPGSDGVLIVHLYHAAVSTSPPMRSGGLKIHKQNKNFEVGK